MAGLAIGFLYGMAEHSINIVMGLWMEDQFRLAVLAIGGIASLVGVAQLGGELLSAFGVDRMSALLCGVGPIRDVMAFPKTQKGTCLMSESPSPVSPDQLVELGISLARPPGQAPG